MRTRLWQWQLVKLPSLRLDSCLVSSAGVVGQNIIEMTSPISIHAMAGLPDDGSFHSSLKSVSLSVTRHIQERVNILDRLKGKEKITQTQYMHLCPTTQSETIPRLYCTPKIHKAGTLLRPYMWIIQVQSLTISLDI